MRISLTTMPLRAGLISCCLGLVLSACGSHSGGLLPSSSTPQSLISESSTGIEVTGTIASVWTGGFTLQAGTGLGYVHVYTSSSTTFVGAPPYASEDVDVVGTGSTSTSITATKVSQLGVTAVLPTPGAAIALPAGVSSWNGTVASVWSGGFTTQIPDHGYVHVYVASSTGSSGGAPAAGSDVQITGTGSTSTSIDATFDAFSSTTLPSVTYSGTVSAATSYGFLLDVNSSYPAVPIVLNSDTVVGGSPLAVNMPVKITGYGGESTSILAVQIVVSPLPTPAPVATPTPTPAPIAQTHVLTADYLGGSDGTSSIAWSAAAPYLTWAQTSIADANAISAAGIKTQYYIDPNRTQTNDTLYTSDETTFAHDCSGDRITDVYDWNGTNVTQYVMDVTQSSMQQLFASDVATAAASAHLDAIFEDDAGPLSGYAAVHPFSPSLPCNYTDSAWLAGGQALDQASSVPIIFNGLNELNGTSPSLSIGLLQSSNTIGGNYEHCYTDDTQAEMYGWQWAAIENTELQVNATGRLFECMERNSASAASSSAARIYAYASFLLTYNPQTSIIWEEFSTPSGFHVEPESQLVALDPTVPAPTDISGLLQTGGAYGRQYGECFVAGNYVGPCAVAVNPSSSLSVPFPYPQYTHTLVLSGGGVLDGGTMATNGAAAPTYLGPTQAVIAFP